MELTSEELTILINSVDAMLNEDYLLEDIEKKKVELLKKMSKELYRRGFTCVISETYLKVK